MPESIGIDLLGRTNRFLGSFVRTKTAAYRINAIFLSSNPDQSHLIRFPMTMRWRSHSIFKEGGAAMSGAWLLLTHRSCHVFLIGTPREETDALVRCSLDALKHQHSELLGSCALQPILEETVLEAFDGIPDQVVIFSSTIESFSLQNRWGNCGIITTGRKLTVSKTTPDSGYIFSSCQLAFPWLSESSAPSSRSFALPPRML
nr:hypothetical protein Iba_chr14aCG15690 [Ipomoea batatas]GMD85582.1 hypothetical protein Iba_chr14aCG25750 [Ipomoea batatas]